jgi:hypothetical protein
MDDDVTGPPLASQIRSKNAGLHLSQNGTAMPAEDEWYSMKTGQCPRHGLILARHQRWLAMMSRPL